jgi:MFS transporter, ACS family, glucarate transporter
VSRYAVVASLFVVSLIMYVDRAAISSAKDSISADFALTDQSMGAVFSAFALGYALAQIPTGRLADRYGPKAALTAVVAGWSLLTAMTGATLGLASLLAVRFLFGAAEAGGFPSANRVYYNWLPKAEHGRANGIVFSGARLGAAGAYPLMTWLLGRWHWRAVFGLLAVPGVLWCAGWLAWFRDYPPEPVATGDGGERGVAPRFTEVLRSQAMLLAMVQYIATNFTTFMTISWMLPYLKQQYRLSASDAAWYASLPLLVAAGSQWFSGVLVDRLYRIPRMRPWSRALPAIAGFGLSSCGLLAVCAAATPGTATAALVVATFGAEMTISPSWAYCLDIGGKNAGGVSGSMNMIGNLSSFVSANAFPFLSRISGTANTYFLLTVVLNLIAAACWVRMRHYSGFDRKGAAAQS